MVLQRIAMSSCLNMTHASPNLIHVGKGIGSSTPEVKHVHKCLSCALTLIDSTCLISNYFESMLEDVLVLHVPYEYVFHSTSTTRLFFTKKKLWCGQHTSSLSRSFKTLASYIPHDLHSRSSFLYSKQWYGCEDYVTSMSVWLRGSTSAYVSTGSSTTTITISVNSHLS